MPLINYINIDQRSLNYEISTRQQQNANNEEVTEMKYAEANYCAKNQINPIQRNRYHTKLINLYASNSRKNFPDARSTSPRSVSQNVTRSIRDTSIKFVEKNS